MFPTFPQFPPLIEIGKCTQQQMNGQLIVHNVDSLTFGVRFIQQYLTIF